MPPSTSGANTNWHVHLFSKFWLLSHTKPDQLAKMIQIHDWVVRKGGFFRLLATRSAYTIVLDGQLDDNENF